MLENGVFEWDRTPHAKLRQGGGWAQSNPPLIWTPAGVDPESFTFVRSLNTASPALRSA